MWKNVFFLRPPSIEKLLFYPSIIILLRMGWANPPAHQLPPYEVRQMIFTGVTTRALRIASICYMWREMSKEAKQSGEIYKVAWF